LVEHVINKVKQTFSDLSEVQILEIGTGSGCIAISLAKLLPNLIATATDFSSDALEVAKTNAERNGVIGRVQFLQSDFLTEVSFPKKFHCIVSNPPYISNDEYQQLAPDVKDFEPKLALADGSDGLTFYKAIAQKAKSLLGDNGFVAVEHAYNQSENVQNIFQEDGWKNIQAVKDYGGNFRLVLTEK
jgi:release factor glutamine methyltransferase